jgi:hypothetical protein
MILAITVLTCASVFGQGRAPVPEDGSANVGDDASQRVDESEESYRARMELRDQRYQEQKRTNMIYSSHGETSKLDQLPEASQEHIKKQLREMIMASRQWKPGEDVSDYPYEPSAAAQTDTKLRYQEREAWAEQLDKYQQREAAAYANAQRGRDGAADDGESGSGKAERNSAAGSVASGQGAPGKTSDSDSYSRSQDASEEISDVGVSENALSFVRGTGGQMEEPVSPAGDTIADSAESASESEPGAGDGSAGAEPLPGSLTLSELAQLQGMDSIPADASGPQSAGLLPAPSTNAEGQGSAGSSSQDAPLAQEEDVSSLADTLAIRDLENLDSTPLQDSPIDLSSDVTGVGENTAAIQAEEPGTLEIRDLERLENN